MLQHIRRARLTRRVSLALAVTALALLAAFGAGAPAVQASPLVAPGDTGSKQGVDLAGPATVRIINEVFATVTCHQCATDGSDFVFPPQQNQEYVSQSSGSGDLISSDGYVLTAYHVVDPTCNDEINGSTFLQDALQDLTTVIQSHGGTADQANALFTQWLNNNQLSIQCAEPAKATVFLSVLYTGPLQSVSQLTGYPVTHIAASSDFSHQDTAVVKIEPNGLDLPYLALAPGNTVNVGDAVTAVAFPGDADTGNFGCLLDPSQDPTACDVTAINNLLTPTVEQGNLISLKHLSDGTPVYETSNISYHGSSGGGALDQQGRIVGFFSRFTDTAAQNNERVTILIPSTIAAQYLAQAGVPNPPHAAPFMTQWARAIRDYDSTSSCHWNSAASELTTLHTKFPQFGGVQPFLSMAESNTSTTCTTSSQTSPPLYLLMVGAGVVGVVVVALLVFVFTRRRRKGTPTLGDGPGGSGGMSQLSQPAIPAIPGPVSQGLYGTPSAPQYPQYPLSVPSTAIPSMPPPYATPTTSYPATPPPPTFQTVRRCTAGHDVRDQTAQFCPQCGAPVQSITVQV